MLKKTHILIVVLILLAALSRLLPHPPNFTPLGAMALFGGAYLGKKYLAFLVPLLAMFLSDIFIGFHHVMWAVYLAFMITVFIGMGLPGSKRNMGRIIIGALASSASFFVITNLAVWIGNPLYGQNIQGLLSCYLAAIPFYNSDLFGSFLFNTVFGDLFFAGILFGSFELIRVRFPGLLGIKA